MRPEGQDIRAIQAQMFVATSKCGNPGTEARCIILDLNSLIANMSLTVE